MSIDLEYAIKKDIRNNPVVREIDREQKRDFLRTMCVAGAIVAMLLFSAWQHFQVVARGYDIEDLRAHLVREQNFNRQYRLDLEVARRPQEIERRAKETLHMVAPTEETTIVIERVPASPPARAIVAAVR